MCTSIMAKSKESLQKLRIYQHRKDTENGKSHTHKKGCAEIDPRPINKRKAKTLMDYNLTKLYNIS